MEYTPDKWVVIKITADNNVYKVFGSWVGGYLNGDSWRINSGVELVSLDGENTIFHGFSGSKYYCHNDAYGMTMYTSGVLLNAIKKSSFDVVILDKNTDWLNLMKEGTNGK